MDFLTVTIPAAIWKVAPIDQEPTIRLCNWSIKRMVEGSFFVGDHIGQAGRVSTDIVQFDEEKKRGITQSGRVYELVGSEGRSEDGEYVWSRYKQLYSLTEFEYK